MKIEITHATDYNEMCRLSAKITDKEGKGIGRYRCGDFSECSEDANLERDLDFVYYIPRWMMMAYEAGKAGEPFEIVEIDEEVDEE